MKRMLLPFLISSAACVAADTTDNGPDQGIPLFDGLGDHHMQVTTESGRAQAYFDQGLRLVYGFNHDEAVRSFHAALDNDSGCAMCYWGVALASGPNINAVMEEAGGVRAFEAIERAVAMRDGATERERAFIDAMARRYGSNAMADRSARDSAYASAMAEVSSRYPDDDDAMVLYADALMNLAPWDYWNADLTPRPGTNELLNALEHVVDRNPSHAGACHFYIHAVEKADPHRAVPCAERLPSLMPGAGHIVHMPAHIYIRVGRYVDAIELNHDAVHADERYIHAEKPRGLYPMAYYPHNYDFLAFAAAMAGRGSEALAAARAGAAAVDQEMMSVPELGGLHNYLVLPLRVMTRFGMWQEILAEPRPDTDLDFPVGLWHHARAMALLRTGDLAGARAEATEVSRRVESEGIEPFYIWWNPARAILSVGLLSLEAEIAYADGDVERAFALLADAVTLEDGLTYDEPPAWMIPPRQVLGRLQLESGRAVEAVETFSADLERHPENGWSLLGLAQSLDAAGRDAEAAAVHDRLASAWATADRRPDAATF